MVPSRVCLLCDPPRPLGWALISNSLVAMNGERDRDLPGSCTDKAMSRPSSSGALKSPQGIWWLLQGPTCRHKPTKQSSFALAEGESRS